MSALPSPGSLAAHDALVQAYIATHGAEMSFDMAPTPVNAAAADTAYLLMVAHAENCGCPMTERDVRAWVKRRVRSYALLMGRDLPEAAAAPNATLKQKA